MSPKTVFLFVFASVLALTLAVDINPQPRPTTVTPDTTTSTPPTTTPTTTPTTAPTTTPTTPPTTTPTTTPPTTTPSTPPTTTTPTTPPTTPSTTVAPITTPAPAPGPKPADVGKWTVHNETTNVTCIIAQMAIQLNVSYEQADNKTVYAILNVPSNTTTATGNCGNMSQVLLLSWTPATNVSHQITLTFNKNETSKLAKVDHIQVDLQATVAEFPGIAAPTTIRLENKQSEFAANLGMSYSCSKLQSLNLTQVDSNTTAGFIHVTSLRVESFHDKTDASFSSAKDCEPSSTTDIVPIAVGCALVALVAIVLVAYLVGRRRSQARGYLSIDDHAQQSDRRI